MLRSRGSSRVKAWKAETNQLVTATRSGTWVFTRVMLLLLAAALPPGVAYGLAPQLPSRVTSSSCTLVSQLSEWLARYCTCAVSWASYVGLRPTPPSPPRLR